MRIRRPSRSLGAALAATAATVLLVAAAPASGAKISYGLSPQTTLAQGDYNLMNTLKTDIIRYGLSWPGVQPSPGNCTPQGGACNWVFPDSQVGSASANGIESMLGIFGSPSWVESSTARPPLKNIGEWQSFIAAAAQRYGPGGAYWSGPYQSTFGQNAPVKPVRVWQVWNEQSSNQFFEPDPDPDKYAKLLVPAAKAIHGADKKADVLTGGMFPDTGPKGIKIEPFLKGLYKAKGVKKNTFDGVSIHPYAKDPKALNSQIKGARKTMNKSGGKKTDIWITEIGYASGGPKSQPVVKKNERAQANAITDAYKFLKKKKNKFKLAGVVYFTWQDVPEGTSCRFCSFAGLLNQAGAEKPAFNAYKKVAK